ncbi:hypothetical protein GCM10025876_17740 [Demequina litorisediminis]|uniref:Alpha-1,4 glucan phosphorylase n=1 Tax=Demequina litorisediminis TaxID=1849022 RepID=A0ABQ6ICX8_9MICO|nr:hypothetical protein GCM10025876_17740 [Demequina litorisediminis]
MEVEPGLGNGGLGRLAACFIDSMATEDIPSIGYGIRYDYGIFKQTFVDGHQVEEADNWLHLGSPWEMPHPENAVEVGFGGHVATWTDDAGREHRRWEPEWNVVGVPYTYMVPGYRNGRVNTLRLWSAKATQAFDLKIFNSGDFEDAVRAQTRAETISQVLYPEDSTPRARNCAFSSSTSLWRARCATTWTACWPMARTWRRCRIASPSRLNDTHPVIAVPELLRILVDERGFDWADAWAITQKVFAYTCHTLLPEALEVWPVELLGRLLPRHLEIIYRINEEFLAQVRETFPHEPLRERHMSIIAEEPVRAVRMAFLATVAGFKVNGVAALHSEPARGQGPHRLRRHVAREVHERHQRRHAAPLCEAREPVTVGTHHRGYRRRLGRGPRPSARP